METQEMFILSQSIVDLWNKLDELNLQWIDLGSFGPFAGPEEVFLMLRERRAKGGLNGTFGDMQFVLRTAHAQVDRQLAGQKRALAD